MHSRKWLNISASPYNNNVPEELTVLFRYALKSFTKKWQSVLVPSCEQQEYSLNLHTEVRHNLKIPVVVFFLTAMFNFYLTSFPIT